MDLGYILRRAWEVTWRHKVLWLFGFLVALGSGISAQSNVNYRSTTSELPPEVQHTIYEFVASPYFVVAIIALVLLGIVIGIVLAFVGALGRAALVDQVREAEEDGTPSASAGFQAGRQHLWPVFLIRFLLRLPVGVLILIGTVPTLVGALSIVRDSRLGTLPLPNILALGSILACLFPAVCLALLLSIPLGVLERLSIRACVLEGRPLGESFRRGWNVLTDNLGAIALLWLILVGIGIGVALVVGLPLMMVTFVVLVPVFMTAIFSPILAVALMLVVSLVVWLLGAAIRSVAETFTSATWTLAYRELTGLGLTGEKPAAA